MWTLISIAIIVLVGFAIFILRVDAREQNRDVERERLARESPTGESIDRNPFS
jgi:hypothetical protein